MPDRVVSREEGEQLAKQHGVPFFETSAKEGININEAFFAMAKSVKSNLLNEKTPTPSQQPVKLGPTSPEAETQKKSSGCC